MPTHRRITEPGVGDGSSLSCLSAYYQSTKSPPQTSRSLGKLQPWADTRSRWALACLEHGERGAPRGGVSGTADSLEARAIISRGRGAGVARPQSRSHGGGSHADRALHG